MAHTATVARINRSLCVFGEDGADCTDNVDYDDSADGAEMKTVLKMQKEMAMWMAWTE